MSMIRRKKYVVLGAAMSVALATCGSGKLNTVNNDTYNTNYVVETTSQTMDDVTADTNEVAYTEKMLTDLSTSLDVKAKDVYKDETVYAFADNEGNIETVIVNEHLKNENGDAVLTDKTDLDNITNIKGYEEYSLDGDTITWEADGKDIYYQGTTDKELPVTVSVKYFLDGKEMAADEIAGKSGKVTIRYEYKNTATIDADGTKVKVPFVAITGLMLDEKFTNVTVVNGKSIEEGNSNIVIGYALPGMSENLGVDAEETGIPEYFEVTADVTDFSLEMGLTLVTSGSSIDIGGEIDFSMLDELIGTVADATGQLSDGSTELSDGASTLYAKMGEFVDGLTTMKAAVNLLSTNVDSLVDGVGKIDAGAQQINVGMTQLNTTLKTPMTDKEKQEIAQTVSSQFAPGTDNYNKIMTSVQSKLGTMETNIYKGLRYNADGSDSPLYSSLCLAGTQGGLTPEQSAAQADATLHSYAQAIASQAGAEVGNVVIAACTESASQGACLGVENTKKKIAESIQPLVVGASDLAAGTSELNSNMPALSDGIDKIVAGMGQLYAGATQLEQGAGKLSDGANTLMNGITTFNEQAVMGIVNAYNGDVKGFTDSVTAMFKAATEYDTFTLTDENKAATTKFIIKTEGVYAE